MAFLDEPIAASTARVEASSEQPMLPGWTPLHLKIVARVPIDFPLSQRESVFFILSYLLHAIVSEFCESNDVFVGV